MKRLQKKQLEFKGGITPFLGLVFVLLLSLIGAMIQSASIQASKSIKRAEMSLALENVFAEYNVTLLEEYDIFVREGSSESEVAERLNFYGVVETQQEVVKSVLLSDSNGYAFYEQAVICMGGTTEESLVDTDSLLGSGGDEVQEELESFLQQDELELPEENNPIAAIGKLKNSNLLSLVYPNQEQLSNRNVKLEGLPSYRTLQKGVGSEERQPEKSIKNQLLFTLYLLEHFPNMLDDSEEYPLGYEVEYLLGGSANDQENLKIVAKKILGIRMAMNYAYLLTDQTKQAEAEAVALGFSSLLAVPEAATLVKHALLLAWAYGESIVDLRILLKGEKVPMIKTSENWQLQISNLFQLETGEEIAGTGGFEEGVSYEDYLKALLLTQDRGILSMRALDLLELNTGIQVDDCITQLEVESTCQLRRGVTYRFRTGYQYK